MTTTRTRDDFGVDGGSDEAQGTDETWFLSVHTIRLRRIRELAQK